MAGEPPPVEQTNGAGKLLNGADSTKGKATGSSRGRKPNKSPPPPMKKRYRGLGVAELEVILSNRTAQLNNQPMPYPFHHVQVPNPFHRVQVANPFQQYFQPKYFSAQNQSNEDGNSGLTSLTSASSTSTATSLSEDETTS